MGEYRDRRDWRPAFAVLPSQPKRHDSRAHRREVELSSDSERPERVDEVTRQRVIDAGAELAAELGIPSEAAELASFYVGLAVGQLVQRIASEHPVLPPSELRSMSRDAILGGMVGMTQTMRAYLEQPVGAGALDAMERCVAALEPISEGVRLVVVRRLKVDIFKGVVGGYGKVKGASSALIFIGDQGTSGVNQRVGYLGEALVLEATRLGLDTCWVGGFFDAGRTATLVDPAEGERIYAVSPLGLVPDEKTAGEKMMSAIARSRRRKPLGVIAPEAGMDTWPAWAMEGLKAAQAAPSAVNRQPWRFSMQEGVVYVTPDSAIDTPKISRRLDCGIAMLHFELAARAAGQPGTWELGSGREVACYRPHAV